MARQYAAMPTFDYDAAARDAGENFAHRLCLTLAYATMHGSDGSVAGRASRESVASARLDLTLSTFGHAVAAAIHAGATREELADGLALGLEVAQHDREQHPDTPQAAPPPR